MRSRRGCTSRRRRRGCDRGQRRLHRGYALWVDEKGLLTHTYSFLGVDTFKQVSTEPLPKGDVTVKMLFETDAPKRGPAAR